MLEVTAYLKVLELESNASLGEIKQAYKDLVTVWHPDRFSHNPRLREKAEGKLKEFNQAYEALRSWRGNQAASSVSAPVYRTRRSAEEPRPRKTHRHYASASHQSHTRSARTQAPHKPPMSHTHDEARITFATAEYILQNYCFIGDCHGDVQQQFYQGGPFVLRACADPPEVMLSVPCDSVRFFDRILLSIPCKSAGHFKREEAIRLLELLHSQ